MRLIAIWQRNAALDLYYSLFCFQFRWIVELKWLCVFLRIANSIRRDHDLWLWIQQLSYASIDLIKCVIVSNFGNQIGAISFSLAQSVCV